jgi:perosamine synthetase
VDGFLDRRRTIASVYCQNLSSLQQYVQLPTEQPWAKHAYWSYPIILRDSVTMCRDRMMKALEEDGIETRPVFYPMHTLPPYSDAPGSFPVADRLASRGICLPMHTLLTDDDIRYISQRVAYWSQFAG